MARIDDTQIQQLKRNVSLLHLCADRGIELKRHGTADYVGKCPFHEDGEPSFVVSPNKNLFHCLGCDAGGSVIDLVMKLDGLTFRQAIDQLMTSTGLIHRAAEPSGPSPQPASLPPERSTQLLERVVSVYEKNLADSPEGKVYLDHRGITDAGLLSRHRIGYSTGKLTDLLPGNGGVRKDLQSLGVLSKSDAEHFTGCLVFPVLDVDGDLTTLYGRFTNDGMKRHIFLPKRPTGLWNAGVMKTYPEIILVESVIDALSVEMAGHPNVVAIQGTNGLNGEHVKLFKDHGVSKLTLLMDGDDAGRKAAKRLKEKLEACGLTSEICSLPSGSDPNDYLQKHGAQELDKLLKAEGESEPTPTVNRADSGEAQAPSLDGLAVTCGLRRYQVMNLDKSSRKLKATIRVEHGGKLHVDTVDFYSARSRRTLSQDLCRLFEESPETIEADVTRLLQFCEQHQPTTDHGPQTTDRPTLSDKEKKEAEAFGKSADLMERILEDYEASGLVGEEPNKLLAYLAATSRKMDEPLSVLVLSSSGAGKTALQDTTLDFVPPEDLVKLTSLSGKALFYKERLALKHKVLALEEGDGAEEASYAIRNLISAGQLVIESTIKDLNTGRLTTMENRVEGPTSVFLTTTDPETDPETKSRFFVTSIDEGREQTRKILVFQRQRQTLHGLVGTQAVDQILTRHRNFQRLLKPVAVVNPYADKLSYGDDRLQGRRDQPKYLNLIKAVAFLRQMAKETHYTKRNGSAVPYVAIDVQDVEIANRLAHEILGRSLDELSRPGRALLLHLDELVERRAEASKGDTKPSRTAITFTRREIRESSGWAHTRVHRYLKELVDLEYVIQDSGRNGTLCRYRLTYEGQGKNGERFMLGLTDPDQL